MASVKVKYDIQSPKSEQYVPPFEFNGNRPTTAWTIKAISEVGAVTGRSRRGNGSPAEPGFQLGFDSHEGIRRSRSDRNLGNRHVVGILRRWNGCN